MGFFDFIGSGIGSSKFDPDKSQFQLPNAGQTQQQSQANMQAALGQQAPGMDASGKGFQDKQSQLSSMLMNQAQNPGGQDYAQQIANAQLKQGTDRNIAQQYAMAQSMGGNQAGARRNIANQAGALNQSAAGQSASMAGQIGLQQQEAQRQYQLATQAQLAGVTQSGVGNAYNQQQLRQNQYGMNQQAALGWGNYGQNANNAQLAAQIAQQQLAAGAYQSAANNAQSTTGGLIGGIASVGSVFAHGGEVPGYAAGGSVGGGLGFFGVGPPAVSQPEGPLFTMPKKGPLGESGQHPTGSKGGSSPQPSGGGGEVESGGSVPEMSGAQMSGPVGGGGGGESLMTGTAPLAGGMMSAPVGGAAAGGIEAAGGIGGAAGAGDFVSMAPLLLAAAYGGAVPDYRVGGTVPGQAEYSGDNSGNDTVDAKLSPGEIVLPRSVTQDPDAEEKAAAFVAAIKAKKRRAA